MEKTCIVSFETPKTKSTSFVGVASGCGWIVCTLELLVDFNCKLWLSCHSNGRETVEAVSSFVLVNVARNIVPRIQSSTFVS